MDRKTLEICRKWTRFTSNADYDKRLQSDCAPVIGDFFTIKRGLATGDNNFFILTREQIEKMDLEMDFFKPILPSPRYLKCDEVFEDKNGYPLLDTQYFLLSCDLPESEIEKRHPLIWNYLSNGINTTAQKYLCKNRRIWYCQES